MRNKRVPSSLAKLQKEYEELQVRLSEAEDTIRAIREGEVDAIVVAGKGGHQIFSLTGSDRVYRLIVETMKEAALTVAVDGTILFCNRQFQQFLGPPQVDILGHRLDEFVDPAQVSSIATLIARSVTQPVKRRLVFVSEGRRPVPAHISATVLNQPDGVSICIVATDLSELEASTEMLQQLRRQQEALVESESRLRAVFAVSHDAILITDDNRRYVEANPAAARLFGIPEEESLLGKHISDFIDPRHDFEEIWAGFRKTGSYQGELHFQRRDGTAFLAEVFAVANVRPGRHLAVLHDITDRKRAEEALRDLNRTLEERVAERTAEAERRAEDLRALAAELTRTEQREQRRVAQWLHDDLQQVLVATKMQIYLTQQAVTQPELRQLLEKASQLIDESIGQSRSLTTELSPPVLYESGLVPGLEQLARWMEEKHGLYVTLETSTDVKPENQEAAGLLFSAARELLFNVVKHSGVSEARVTLTEKEEQLRLSVEDHGSGFDPFLGERALSGFGLFHLRERMRSIGGELQIQSAPGQGACMTLIVPSGPIFGTFEPKQAKTHSTTSVIVRAAAPLPVERQETSDIIRVLLVDDHQMVREGLAGLLARDRGVKIVGQAGEGTEAVDLAEQVRPDVVIMDVNMPGMNGIQATSRIKAKLPEVRVIGLSMLSEKEHRAAMTEAGADAYLEKGGAGEELLTTIRMVTRRREDKGHPTGC